jgi:hypothetical protein
VFDIDHLEGRHNRKDSRKVKGNRVGSHPVSSKIIVEILILLESPMRHVRLHHGMRVMDTARHGTHVFAINQHRDSQRFNDQFDGFDG